MIHKIIYNQHMITNYEELFLLRGELAMVKLILLKMMMKVIVVIHVII